jgi:uncharacterized repeat protein (TIGR01451 family)
VPVGQTTTLTLTITNPAANTVALSGVGFTDTFPAGLQVASPLTFANGCGGNLTDNLSAPLNAGDSGIRLAGGTVGTSPPRTCTITINVTAFVPGPFVNTTEQRDLVQRRNGQYRDGDTTDQHTANDQQ